MVKILTSLPYLIYFKFIRVYFLIGILTLTTQYLSYQYLELPFLVSLLVTFIMFLLMCLIYERVKLQSFKELVNSIKDHYQNFDYDIELKTLNSSNEWQILKYYLNTIIQKSLSQQDQIDHSNLQINRTIESVPHPVLIVGPSFEPLFYNTSMKEEFQIANEKYKNVKEFIPRVITTLIFEVISTRKNSQIKDFPGERNNYFNVTCSPFFDGQKNFLGSILIFQDITQEKKTEQMRVDFIANISHELRTPLTSIKGYTQLLSEYNKDRDNSQKKFFDSIESNINKIDLLFTKLLNLSKIETSTYLKKQHLNLKVLINQALSNSSLKYSSVDFEVFKEVEDIEIWAEPLLFENAISNLLENSFKYREKSRKLKLTIKAQNLNDENIILTISDNGMGIDPEYLSRIFERFYRTKEAIHKQQEGHGLGLSIVKHIIQKHNGTIEVDSSNMGTTFTITLPQKSN